MLTYSEFWIFSACLLGAVQCFLLALYFLFLKSGNRRAHRIFSLLMLLIGLRLLKSGHYIFIGEDMPLIWMNLGFAAHLAAGPLSWIYLRFILGGTVSQRKALFHLAPALVLIVLAPWLRTENFWYLGGYSLLLCYTLAYFGSTVRMWWKSDTRRTSPPLRNWTLSLLVGVGVFFLTYFSNYVMRVLPYEFAPVLYSLAVLPMSLAAWRNYPELIKTSGSKTDKYGNLHLNEDQLGQYRSRIMAHLEQKQSFLDPDFDLSGLAAQTGIPSHLLSMTLSQHMETNFPRLINDFRVMEACRLLEDDKRSHHTIAAIAFDAGFNSISVFNHHFKRYTGQTPSTYRKQLGDQLSK